MDGSLKSDLELAYASFDRPNYVTFFEILGQVSHFCH